MSKIEITPVQLKNSASVGEKKASKALSVMSKKKVVVKTIAAKPVSGEEAKKAFEGIKEHMVVAYMQALTGVSGLSLLALERQDALTLVDLFNSRPQGTTTVLQEIDRSTIRETLNILANSYVAEMANEAGAIIKLDVPKMVTSARVDDLSSKVSLGEGSKIVLFQTELSVEEAEFQVSLYFFFLTKV